MLWNKRLTINIFTAQMALVVAFSLVLAACGGQTDEAFPNQTPSTTSTTSSTSPDAAALTPDSIEDDTADGDLPKVEAAAPRPEIAAATLLRGGWSAAGTEITRGGLEWIGG